MLIKSIVTFILSLLCILSCKTSSNQLFSDPSNEGQQCKCLPDNDCWTAMESDLENLKPKLSSPDVLINSFELSEIEKCKPDFSSAECQKWAKRDNAKPVTTSPYYLQSKSWASIHAGLHNAWEQTASKYAIGAKNAQDVSEAVKFAAKHDLKVVVKSGGHDYLGRSQAPDSFLIWTHHMRDIAFNQANNDLTTCNKSHTISVGAGARWGEVYDYLLTGAGSSQGRYLTGGAEQSVGVAGFTLGGGMSFFAKQFGPTASYLVSMEVVTADGQIRTVSACSDNQADKDLFFALRGAGMGSYGVVTKFTFETIKQQEINPGVVFFNVATRNEESFKKVIEFWLKFYYENFNKENFANIISFKRLLLPPRPNEPKDPLDDMNGWVGVLATDGFMSNGLPEAQIIELFTKFKNEVTSIPGVKMDPFPEIGLTSNPYIAAPEPIASYRKKLQTLDPDFGLQYGSASAVELRASFTSYDSTWIPSTIFDGNMSKLADAIYKATKVPSIPKIIQGQEYPGYVDIQFHISKAMHLTGHDRSNMTQAQQRILETSMNPQILDSPVQIISASLLTGFNADKEKLEKGAQATAKAMGFIRDVVGDKAGTYINESNYFDPNWIQNNYGTHYSRLLNIKDREDPNGLFTCHHCVGSQDWNAKGTCRIAGFDKVQPKASSLEATAADSSTNEQ